MKILITLSPEGKLNITAEPADRPFMVLDLLRKAADGMISAMAERDAQRGQIEGEIPPGLAQRLINGR